LSKTLFRDQKYVEMQPYLYVTGQIKESDEKVQDDHQPSSIINVNNIF
jgi:hypothetical protein